MKILFILDDFPPITYTGAAVLGGRIIFEE